MIYFFISIVVFTIFIFTFTPSLNFLGSPVAYGIKNIEEILNNIRNIAKIKEHFRVGVV